MSDTNSERWMEQMEEQALEAEVDAVVKADEQEAADAEAVAREAEGMGPAELAELIAEQEAELEEEGAVDNRWEDVYDPEDERGRVVRFQPDRVGVGVALSKCAEMGVDWD